MYWWPDMPQAQLYRSQARAMGVRQVENKHSKILDKAKKEIRPLFGEKSFVFCCWKACVEISRNWWMDRMNCPNWWMGRIEQASLPARCLSKSFISVPSISPGPFNSTVLEGTSYCGVWASVNGNEPGYLTPLFSARQVGFFWPLDGVWGKAKVTPITWKPYVACRYFISSEDLYIFKFGWLFLLVFQWAITK